MAAAIDPETGYAVDIIPRRRWRHSAPVLRRRRGRGLASARTLHEQRDRSGNRRSRSRYIGVVAVVV
jgi:hypothetical protein